MQQSSQTPSATLNVVRVCSYHHHGFPLGNVHWDRIDGVLLCFTACRQESGNQNQERSCLAHDSSALGSTDVAGVFSMAFFLVSGWERSN
jgi:hypothetical protein